MQSLWGEMVSKKLMVGNKHAHAVMDMERSLWGRSSAHPVADLALLTVFQKHVIPAVEPGG